MALPVAQPAEVLRAYQKDDLYEKQLAGSIARLVPSYHASKAIPVSSLLYKSFTTLKDLQTLGEEYSGIVQVDETYHRLPSFSSRLLSILLSAFGENLTRRLLSHIEKQIVQNSSLKPQAQNLIIIVLKTLSNVVPQIESIHRALSYITGGPLQIGKTATGINYVHVRPAAAAYYAHLRLLGIVTLLHAFISCGQSLYQAKKQMDDMSDFPNEVDNSKSCIACLEEIIQPSVLQCGHLFCMQCCYGVLDSCPLCRSPFSKNTVVPLMNYSP
ncbi:peroxisome biogenesis factor 10-like [Pararge aegeria]|uniref:RING-type E3 ubiquitin transferase n=1 Tax=Pararge aegeria aegeria TaxID=348720 RepID=A0A8S4R809_9NEOP|nr:peroxisome biogenesis factor 10-like [Pararge aegeria]CAH2231845.1 jg11044 [Pararge aegeria aegeria]